VNALNQAETAGPLLLDRRTVEDPEVQWATYRIRQIEEQLSTIARTYLGGLTEHVRGLDRTLAGFSSAAPADPGAGAASRPAPRQAGVTEELYTTLQLRLKETEIMAAVDDPTVRIIDPAVFPRRPVRPNVPLSLALALMAGWSWEWGRPWPGSRSMTRSIPATSCSSWGACRFWARFRDSIPPFRTGGGSRSCVPAAAGNGHGGVRLLDAVAMPGVGEAYRSLRTNITFARLDQTPRTIVVTSPAPGRRQVHHCRQPRHHHGAAGPPLPAHRRRHASRPAARRFGARREPGLSNVLLGQVTLRAAVVTETGGQDRPSLLTTGTVPPNPAELLGSDRMGQLLAEALDAFDLVVIDAPPLNMVTDAAVLSRHADGVLVVARAGVTQQTALAYTFDQLAAVNAPVLGSILNDADPQRERHYGSYMRGYYEPHA
jgi:capsular exopolysaccharide synthesis family protein